MQKMHALSWASGLALLLWLVEAQSPPYYYHSWLYATPWRPLVPVQQQQLDTQQLSLGYTGPQTFPLEAGQAQAQAMGTVRRPILLELQLRPARQQFTVPFRPSPFAGYSNEEEQLEQGQQQVEQRHQQLEQLNQHVEPPFYAPGYPQSTAVVASPLIGEDQAEQKPPHFIYMAPSNQYNLVRS